MMSCTTRIINSSIIIVRTVANKNYSYNARREKWLGEYNGYEKLERIWLLK